jgi:hypothetical protein
MSMSSDLASPTPTFEMAHDGCSLCDRRFEGETRVLREENRRLRVQVHQQDEMIKELQKEVEALDCQVFHLLHVIEVAQKRAKNMEQECLSLWREVEDCKRDIERLKREVEDKSGNPNNLSATIAHQRLFQALQKLGDKRTQFEDSLSLAEFLEDFEGGEELGLRERRKAINELEVRGREQRERLTEYESLVMLYGDCLEDIVLARLMKNTVEWHKRVEKTEVGQSIIEETKTRTITSTFTLPPLSLRAWTRHKHTHTHTHKHMHKHTHKHTQTHTHKHMHKHTHKHTQTHTHKHMHKHTQTHTNTHKCTHKHTHKCTHRHTHKYTHLC